MDKVNILRPLHGRSADQNPSMDALSQGAPLRSLFQGLVLDEQGAEVVRLRQVLQAEAVACELTWVNSLQAFGSALAAGWAYDLILAAGDGDEALAMAQRTAPRTPFLFLAEDPMGAQGERLLRAGAVDVLPAGDACRLAHGVRRALQEARQAVLLRDAQAASARTLSVLRATLDATSEGILVTDLAGKVATYNHNFLTLCGIPKDVMAPMALDRVLQFLMGQFRDPEAFLSEARLLGAQEGREASGLLRAQGGRILEGHERPHTLEHKAEGKVFSFRDVTDREKAAEQQLQAEAALDQHLREGMATLVAGATRAFQEPLGKIRTRVELLRDSRPLTEAQQRHLKATDKALGGLEGLLKQLAPPPPGAGAPALDLNELVESLRPRAEAALPREVVLRFLPGTGLPAVPVDAVQLQQVLLGLIANAREALQGAGEILLRTGLTENPGGVFLEVQDDGPGLAPHVVAHLFEPFFTTKAGALGLGLWLARTFADHHQGTIRALAAGSHGTRIRIDFPVEAPCTSAR